MENAPILVINTGSSSLKMGLYTFAANDVHLLFDGGADGIGRQDSKLTIRDASGKTIKSEAAPFSAQPDALREAVRWLRELEERAPSAIGHRVVHGGPRLVEHQRITPAVLEELRNCVHFAPLHIPLALALIEEAQRLYPEVPQFACFDTAFHQTIPEVATRFALPRELFEQGIRRYGFHGISYESIVQQLGAELRDRTVVAHLGSGASLVALREGRSLDTTMGLTPTGGIPMATRTGDIDPGVLLYLMRNGDASAGQMEDLLNHQSGLKAISGSSGDMRDLEAATSRGDRNAQMAIDIFCRSVAKVIAGYAGVLGGIDALVFSGGIGEHSSLVRAQACKGLEFLGVTVDEQRNNSQERVISSASARVSVQVIPSEEDKQIARTSWTLLTTRPG